MGRLKLTQFILDIISFNTPQAIVFNFTVVLLILFLLPTEKLYLLPIRSIYENVFGITPYSSGITRALSRLLHGDVESALAFNKLVFPVLAVVIFLIVINLGHSLKEYRRTGKIYNFEEK